MTKTNETRIAEVVSHTIFGSVIELLSREGIDRDSMMASANEIAAIAKEEAKAAMPAALADAEAALDADMSSVAEITFVASFRVAALTVVERCLSEVF